MLKEIKRPETLKEWNDYTNQTKTARAFIEMESKKEFATPERFFKSVDGLRAFYLDIMEDINGEKSYITFAGLKRYTRDFLRV